MTLQKTLDFLKKKKIRVNSSNDLGSYTTIRIGGQPAVSVIPDTRARLEETICHLIQQELPWVLLGGGSNVAFEDNPSSLIAVINRTGEIKQISSESLYVDSGVNNSTLISYAMKEGTGGIEFISGIPGTIGGAAAVHAGAFGKSMSDIIVSADIINSDGEICTITPEEFCFQYRNSRFKYSRNEVILGLTLKTFRAEPEKVKQKAIEYIDYRKTNHPPSSKFSAGCFFKNPVVNGEKRSAGKAIETSGLKGYSSENLQISHQHANFLINDGTASFRDLSNFACEVNRIVKEKEGVELQREIIFISDDGRKY